MPRAASSVFLSAFPFVVIPVVGIRPLRIPGLFQAAGVVLCGACLLALWALGARSIRPSSQPRHRQVLAALLFAAPYVLVSLLWVGLGTPWDASPVENRMRYAVLTVDSIAITSGFLVLRGVLHEMGERFYSAAGHSTAVLAGAAYLVWTCFTLGVYVVRVQTGRFDPAAIAMSDVLDVLLFVATALTYVTTALFAASLGRLELLGQRASRAYVVVNVVMLVFLGLRGLSYPDPTASSTPWYVRPGFIAGIPAVPWVMPFLLGVVLLRRAGDDAARTQAQGAQGSRARMNATGQP